MQKNVEIWRSSDRNKLHSFFWDTVYIRHPAGLGAWPVALQYVYSRHQQSRRVSRPQNPSVCWRLSSLCHRSSFRSSVSCWPLFAMCRRVANVSKWLSSSRLRLNPAKTLVIWLGGRQQVTSVEVDSVPELSSTVTTVDSARDLSVVLDSQLAMSAHVSSVCQ